MIAEIALVILLPKPPPVYSLMTTTLHRALFIDQAQPARDRRNRLRGALRAGVNVDLAVLPVRHGGAGFERLVAGVGRDEGLVQHQRGVLEARFDIAERPFGSVGLAHRQLAVLGRPRSLRRSTSIPALAREAERRRLAGALAASGRIQTLPSTRAFGPPGRRLTSGSTTMRQALDIDAGSSRWLRRQVSSSTAQTARIGSP